MSTADKVIWMELKLSLAVFLDFRALPVVIQAWVERLGGWRLSEDDPLGSTVSSTSPTTLETHQTKPTTNKQLHRAKPNNQIQCKHTERCQWKGMKDRKTSKGGGAWRPAIRCLNI